MNGWYQHERHTNAYLDAEVIPPVWPGLLDTSLLFEHGPGDDGSEYRERHRDTMVVVGVHDHIALQLWERQPSNY